MVVVSETADVVLRGGGTVHVRPMAAEDVEAVAAFLASMSEQSRYFRFFGGGIDVRRVARDLVKQSAADRVFALVAVLGSPERVVGLAELARIDGDSAEVAFTIADTLHGQGLGTVLLAHLAQHARAVGIERLEAYVMRGNTAMANVFRDSGYGFTARSDPEGLVFEAPATLSPEGLARFDERVRVAMAASVARVLRPASVAVVGAVGDARSPAGKVVASLAQGGYPGPVVAVAHEDELADPADLVVVGVAPERVTEVARRAAALQCGAIVVLPGGFADAGPAGAGRQRELVAVCRGAGMRLVGPNSLGVANTDPDVRLNATAGAVLPPAGDAALLTQSGALGLSLLEQARLRGLGLSSFVSVGNKADLSGNDLLTFWERDDVTRVVLLYLESFGNPRNFARITRRMSCTKPIVVMKSGRTSAGARATASHTGSVLESSDVSVDALFQQSGVVRADSLSELLDVGQLLSRQPLPRGSRVGIVVDAGGPGVLAADACGTEGLEVPEVDEELGARLRRMLPSESVLGNPVNVLPTAAPHDLSRAVRLVAESGLVDAVIAVAVHVDAVAALRRAAFGEVPLLVVQMTGQRQAAAGGPPVYRFPEDAARALAHAVRYARWRSTPRGEPPVLGDVDRERAAAVLAGVRAEERWLDLDETTALLTAWGLPFEPGRRVGSADEAGAVAATSPGPVAVKAVAPGLRRKADAGGVVLGVLGPEEARAAAVGIAERLAGLGRAPEAFVVQPMITGGIEMLVGVTTDPMFGPVVACGAGGERAELERDVAVRLTPVTRAEAGAMIGVLRTYPVLEGWRGGPRADVGALQDIVVRVAALADAHPEVLEVDLHPVSVLEHGAAVLDARVRVAPPPPEPLWPAIGASPPRG